MSNVACLFWIQFCRAAAVPLHSWLHRACLRRSGVILTLTPVSGNNAVVGGAGGDGGDGNGNVANGGDDNSGDFSGNGGFAVGDNGNGGTGGTAIGGRPGHCALLSVPASMHAAQHLKHCPHFFS